MEYPVLYEQRTSRQVTEVFNGYNRNLRIGDGEFQDMENLTSDFYPVLSPRGARSVYTIPEGIELCGIAVNHGLFLSGVNNFYAPEIFNHGVGYEQPNDLISHDVQRPVNMGSYVVVPSIKRWANLAPIAAADGNPFSGASGVIENYFTGFDVEISLCKQDGSSYGSISDTEPENPEDGQLWMDTSGDSYALKQWSKSTGIWASVATTYLRLKANSIGKGFKVGDGVRYHFAENPNLTLPNCTLGADGSAVIQAIDPNNEYIVVIGLIKQNLTVTTECKIARVMPEMDFVIECNNRLWGCKYGVVKDPLTGEMQDVNEIYCCKLGDFTNWDVYQGISTDSYRVSIGADGLFTGAINYLGYPMFFKENCIIRISGDYPANFRLTTTSCDGVQEGSGHSLALVNNVVYYWSRRGVCAYDGSLPVFVGGVFGTASYRNAVGGSYGGKYYLSVEENAHVPGTRQHTLFVYDTGKGLWHKESGLNIQAFAEYNGQMLAMVEGENFERTLQILAGSSSNEAVEWFAETGPIGITSPDMKYVARLTLRLALGMGASLRIFAKYDFSDEWEQACCLEATNLRSFSLPIRPKRCDHMYLRLEGVGDCKLYSITKTISEGSELS